MAPQTRLTTRFCQRLGVLAPVVLAPMGGCAGGRLAAAVAAAGGVGLVGSGGESLAYLRSEWATAVSQPGVSRQNLGFGMNINQLEEHPAGTLEALLEELQPGHLFLSFGSLAPHAQAAREAGVHLYSNAGDTATALAHARDGATCVVMQGSDAGGHTGDRASVFSLVPQARTLPQLARLQPMCTHPAGYPCVCVHPCVPTLQGCPCSQAGHAGWVPLGYP